VPRRAGITASTILGIARRYGPLVRVAITGAASGIGRATAERLQRDGWDVVAVDVEASPFAASYRLDLRDPIAIADVFAAIGPVDALVNDAGIGYAATVVDTTTEQWDAMLAVNLTAMFHTTKAVLPAMLERRRGSIVNLASVAGVVGVRNRAGYCATKGGVIAFTRAIAADHAADGIRANAICPGTVDTEWIGKILADAPDPAATRAAMEARQLDGRMGSPEEVAAGIAFLLSDDGRFVNGSAWVMDGGMTAV
jgi:NAD(P)-dependent dehydrogenase (short-subunit alcohol dehydrogenase family)